MNDTGATSSNKVQVGMTEDEVEMVISALNSFADSLQAGPKQEAFIDGKEGGLKEMVKLRYREDAIMLSDRLAQGISGRGGEGFGLYRLGNLMITEQERQLLIFALKFLVAGDDYARRKLRWRETKEWEMDFVAQLEEKLNDLSKGVPAGSGKADS